MGFLSLAGAFVAGAIFSPLIFAVSVANWSRIGGAFCRLRGRHSWNVIDDWHDGTEPLKQCNWCAAWNTKAIVPRR